MCKSESERDGGKREREGEIFCHVNEAWNFFSVGQESLIGWTGNELECKKEEKELIGKKFLKSDFLILIEKKPPP